MRNHVDREEVLLVVPPHILYMGGVSQEGAPSFLMTEMKKPRTFLVGVRLEVKQVVNLMRSWHGPFFVAVKDIECNKHSISIGSYLKRGDTKVIGHPHKKGMKGEISSRLNMIPRPGAVCTSGEVSPLVFGRTYNGNPYEREFPEGVSNHSKSY